MFRDQRRTWNSTHENKRGKFHKSPDFCDLWIPSCRSTLDASWAMADSKLGVTSYSNWIRFASVSKSSPSILSGVTSSIMLRHTGNSSFLYTGAIWTRRLAKYRFSNLQQARSLLITEAYSTGQNPLSFLISSAGVGLRGPSMTKSTGDFQSFLLTLSLFNEIPNFPSEYHHCLSPSPSTWCAQETIPTKLDDLLANWQKHRCSNLCLSPVWAPHRKSTHDSCFHGAEKGIEPVTTGCAFLTSADLSFLPTNNCLPTASIP